MRKIYLSTLILFCLMQGRITVSGQAAPDEKMLSGTSVGPSLSQLYAPNLFNGTMNGNIQIYGFSKEGSEYGFHTI